MWHKVTIAGHDYFLFRRDSKVTQVLVGSDHRPAAYFRNLFPDLFRALVERLEKRLNSGVVVNSQDSVI